MNTSMLAQFRPTIRQLVPADFRDPGLLRSKMLLARDGDITVHYAPLDHINPRAKVVIVGITPGATQMVNAITECRRQLEAGASDEVALKAAKMTGAFSGSMRPNLVGMLDHIGLASRLNIGSAAALFGASRELVQTTSLLKYPVLFRGENYNGTPNMLKQPLLLAQLLEGFGADIGNWPGAVFIPLGDKVSAGFEFLAGRGLISRDQILDGLPHPSGANAERIAYFMQRKSSQALSAKTDPVKLDSARVELLRRVACIA